MKPTFYSAVHSISFHLQIPLLNFLSLPVTLQSVAVVAVIGDGGSQLQLSADTGSVLHHAWLKARLSGILW